MATKKPVKKKPTIKISKERIDMTKLKKAIYAAIIALISALAGFGLNLVVRPETEVVKTEEKTVEVKVDTGSSVEFAPTDEPVEIDIEAAPFIDYDVKTVDSVDGGQTEAEAGETVDDINSAQGAYYRTDTFENFIEDTVGKCVIEGNIFGAQCVSLSQAYWLSYSGRGLDTCGTGAARGLWTCREKNAGDDFALVYDATAIQAGDWIITNGGQWGHVAMAVGGYNNGYIAVYGENQGGKPCADGGSQPNVINLNMNTFLGAFRPKAYIIPEPVVVPDAPDTGVFK